jgi:hypothetical protein
MRVVVGIGFHDSLSLIPDC